MKEKCRLANRQSDGERVCGELPDLIELVQTVGGVVTIMIVALRLGIPGQQACVISYRRDGY